MSITKYITKNEDGSVTVTEIEEIVTIMQPNEIDSKIETEEGVKKEELEQYKKMKVKDTLTAEEVKEKIKIFKEKLKGK